MCVCVCVCVCAGVCDVNMCVSNRLHVATKAFIGKLPGRKCVWVIEGSTDCERADVQN